MSGGGVVQLFRKLIRKMNSKFNSYIFCTGWEEGTETMTGVHSTDSGSGSSAACLQTLK